MKKLIIILTFLCSLQILRAEIILDSEYETYEQLLDDTIFDNTSTLSRIAAMKRRISSIPYNYTLCQSIPRYCKLP